MLIFSLKDPKGLVGLMHKTMDFSLLDIHGPTLNPMCNSQLTGIEKPDLCAENS
jgi:hypothetical protein